MLQVQHDPTTDMKEVCVCVCEGERNIAYLEKCRHLASLTKSKKIQPNRHVRYLYADGIDLFQVLQIDKQIYC